MNALAAFCFLQIAAAGTQSPVLEFPEAGLDDPAAYEGYTTRFFRDARGNAFQIYLDARSGRVVHIWADGANASAAFNVRDSLGEPAHVVWADAGAIASEDGRGRIMQHRLASALPALQIGWFVLGTMRQERDFQYWEWHRRPYGDGPFVLDEFSNLVTSLERLPPAERDLHLSLLNAHDLASLRSRLHPRMTLGGDARVWTVLVEHTSLDGRTDMTIELRGDARESAARLTNGVVSVQTRGAAGIRFDVVTTTNGPSLTPLDRDEIFNEAFESFYSRERFVSDSLRRTLPPRELRQHPAVTSFRRLERAVLGLELLSYEEKLMAALPNYATYFGRDMMMSALMLEPVVSPNVQEHVIANVLRKVTSAGDVSHEEALGGQAIRENAADYSATIRTWEEAQRAGHDSARQHLEKARDLLRNLHAVRENYRMIDDDFQLPVLVDRYLSRSDVPAERKRRFLNEAGPNGLMRLDALVRNLALVTHRARPYAEEPVATNLVEFLFRDDDGWFPGSWRDSRVGYGNGRFAMDVNAVWVPKALEATESILRHIRALGLRVPAQTTDAATDTEALDTYRRDPAVLRQATATWRDARRHFAVSFDSVAIRERVQHVMDWQPTHERAYWSRILATDPDATRPMSFIALALDDVGRPIAAANTDPATDLFLGDYTEQIVGGTASPTAVTEMLDVFMRPYPVGLFVQDLGPLVVNDAYASPKVQQQFRDDLYHSPRVVWGREVNLLLLGLARQIEAAYDASGGLRGDPAVMEPYVALLRNALEMTRQAVEASGMRHNELWSYRIDDAGLRPVRYGTSSDIQLWNLTDLAVRYVVHKLPPP